MQMMVHFALIILSVFTGHTRLPPINLFAQMHAKLIVVPGSSSVLGDTAGSTSHAQRAWRRIRRNQCCRHLPEHVYGLFVLAARLAAGAPDHGIPARRVRDSFRVCEHARASRSRTGAGALLMVLPFAATSAERAKLTVCAILRAHPIRVPPRAGALTATDARAGRTTSTRHDAC
jgi:hypothetical protein